MRWASPICSERPSAASSRTATRRRPAENAGDDPDLEAVEFGPQLMVRHQLGEEGVDEGGRPRARRVSRIRPMALRRATSGKYRRTRTQLGLPLLEVAADHLSPHR